MYITRRRLTEIRTAAGLPEADEGLARHVAPLVTALTAAQFDEQIDESDGAVAGALASRLGLTVSELYKVLELARAAGRLVKLT